LIAANKVQHGCAKFNVGHSVTTTAMEIEQIVMLLFEANALSRY
jgi:hypothetical protein